MYLPRQFEQTDAAAMAALMREHPLATLVITTPEGSSADLIPLEYHADVGVHGSLRGHVARANPLWRKGGAEALAIFQGPQAYISPGWYASKRVHGKVVPTWNYTMVQARGTLRAIDDAAWLRDFVGGLTARHESAQSQPWSIDDAPDDFLQSMLKMIVGIEIPLISLLGKWKVSQNRDRADREGAAAGLGAHPMAKLVRSPSAS